MRKDIKDNFIKTIADEWALISVGTKDKYNMMTASWGLWVKCGGTTALPPLSARSATQWSLWIKTIISLSFYGDNKAIHKVCGSKSGRDTDKTAEQG